MLDIGWQELLMICAVAVVVVGPRELPKTVRAITGFLRKMRAMASDFQNQITDIADFEDVKNLKNEVSDMKNELVATASDPTGLGDKLRGLEDDQKQIADEFNRATNPDFANNTSPKTTKQASKKTAKKAGKKIAKKANIKAAKVKIAVKKPVKKPNKNKAKNNVIKPPSLIRKKA